MTLSFENSPYLDHADDEGGLSRRRLLAAASATAIGATAGCVQQAQSVLGRSSSSQVSLSIATVVADVDPKPAQIARHLRSHLEAVGISTDIEFYDIEEFRLELLVNKSFDIAVARHPGDTDPDVLYEMFHSSFGPESGWQNPYGFSDIDIDEQLEAQRTQTGTRREETVKQVLAELSVQQPVAPLCVPEEYRLVRLDRLDGYTGRRFNSTSDILALTQRSDRDELSLSIIDNSPTENLNPLSVEYRRFGVITGLLYDSLVIEEDGEYLPWLASSVAWTDGSVDLTLRDARWHDGESVTAADVAFTYRLLRDSSLGKLESPAPVSRFRGQSQLVTDIEVHDDRTLTLSIEGSEEIAPRALTVPILPEHEWVDRTEPAEIAGLTGNQMTTEAVVVDNIPPVGSGPYQFEDRSRRNELVLEQFPDHFVGHDDSLAAFYPPSHRLNFVVAPSDDAAIAGIQDGDIDLTLTPIWYDAFDEDDWDGDEWTTFESQTTNFYHIAYNTRDRPLSNPQFRRLVSRLLDKFWVVENIFDGHARPISTPIADQRWVPQSLRLDGRDECPEVPFFGSDGVLDADDARNRLVELGYQYNEDGEVVAVGGG